MFPVHNPARTHEKSVRVVSSIVNRSVMAIHRADLVSRRSENEIESIRVGSGVQRAKEFINSDGGSRIECAPRFPRGSRYFFGKFIRFSRCSSGYGHVSEDNIKVSLGTNPFFFLMEMEYEIFGFSKRFRVFLYVLCFFFFVFCVLYLRRQISVVYISRVHRAIIKYTTVKRMFDDF